MNTSVIRTGIIGFGKSGRNIHTPLIDACNGIALKSVVSRSGPEQIPGREELTVLRSAEELIKADDIDLVVITTPNHLHCELAEKALHAGKHVVVDKPFTVRADEALRLNEIAGNNGKVLTVFHNRRWDGDFISVSNLIQQNAVGRLTEFESRFDRFRNQLRDNAWKEKNLPGSGILYDLGPHLIDQSVHLFGKPEKLFAEIRHQRGGDADDWFDLRFYYDGFSVALKAGMLVADKTPRFVLRGEKGAFTQFGIDPQEQALADGKDPNSPDWGRKEVENFGLLRTWKGNKFIEDRITVAAGEYPSFYRNVADAIHGKTELHVKPEEAAEVIRLIEVAKKSNRDGKIVEC
jgi:scyllo-inositol 2-dehydrogenase (NADP+)